MPRNVKLFPQGGGVAHHDDNTGLSEDGREKWPFGPSSGKCATRGRASHGGATEDAEDVPDQVEGARHEDVHAAAAPGGAEDVADGLR